MEILNFIKSYLANVKVLKPEDFIQNKDLYCVLQMTLTSIR